VKGTRLILAVAACLLTVSVPLFAHHGRVGYDNEKVLTLKATVTGFEWSNPHIQIHFDAPDEKGVVQHWTVEGSNPFSHQRIGWTKDEFKPGDHITITFHPAKNGYSVGYLMNAITASGKKVGLAEGSSAPQ
jgi:uncharacterized protein DUF6152